MRAIIHQIWRFVWIAATGPGSGFSLMLLVVIVACQLAIIQVTLRQVQWSADFFNALQKIDGQAAITQIGVFAVLVGISASLYLIAKYCKRRLQFRWRQRLSDTLLERWTTNKAHWFLHPSLGGHAKVDNPDQRIAEDCNMFAEAILGSKDDIRAGVLDFMMSLIGLVSYVMLLWQLSTFALQFSLWGVGIEIPRYMVWAAPIYVALATTLTHVLGRQLPGLLMNEQRREADFRFALVHMRENASAIALSDGETAERRMLADRFNDVVSVWHQVIRREFIYGLFTRPYFQSVLRIPTFLALPAFLAGKITLGGLTQLAAAFTNVVTTLSWFIFSYKFISDLVATTRRLQGFMDAMDGAAPEPHALRRERSGDSSLQIRGLGIRAPDGRMLVELPNLSVARGETVWLSGASGLGKSTLIKALAGLWPHAEGLVTLPSGKLAFMPQQVYMPLCSLMDAAVYPADPGSVPRETVERLLRGVGLGPRLDAGDHRASGLSVGEQQRLALVRLMVSKPDWIFADEATSALDAESERIVMALLRSELPDATLVMVAHREPHGFAGIRRVVLDTLSDDGAMGPNRGVLRLA
ncbi:ABC transporter ATP-binding protein/permease [Tardiphaga sp. 42S5]|uniref:ABC transporter ATP-binding protein/permease n=1 Tax=Tardiphaga sp. 42S5 TaxID=1404799 RepID=UPI002A5A2292|nr:ABC transporter ATP-binding protein/permease [Tardiphaga sp. 42S5]WPO39621.1 ABC transporter ATP-binding protein/permease [Tardiphaga sp. 42S5]